VDYIGPVDQFCKEFDEDLAVIAYAVNKFGLPGNLKLSVHWAATSFHHGGCKVAENSTPAHLKTAGNDMAEELSVDAGGDGLTLPGNLYRSADTSFSPAPRW
jgi:hypothetical protein